MDATVTPETTALRAVVAGYLERGWSVVPIEPGAKRPSATDWTRRTFTLEDFVAPSNVGVKLGECSRWLVDIDCDILEAAHVAYRNLAGTLNHGRDGRPHSHYWFCAPEARPYQFTDLQGKVIIEIRANGQQTVLPPSVHATGEVLAWDNPDAPLGTASADQIHKIAAEIAATVLVAQHWPTGSRHFAAAALGGFLFRLGFEPPLIGAFVRNVCWLAKDDEVEDRVRAAQDTADKMTANASTPTTGAPKLVELLINGSAVVTKLRDWYGAGNDEVLDELNERHFVVRIGKNVVVGIEPGPGDDKIDFLPFDEFNKLYYNRAVGKKKLAQWWLEHPRRRTYRRVVMVPPGTRVAPSDQDYNLWRGFAVEPMADRDPLPHIRKYLAHVHHVIAKNDDGVTDLVLDLLADCVQRPGDPVGRALALRGAQGTGKSMFVEHFGKLFGHTGFVSISSREALVGNFNAHLASKIVVFADEAVWGGNRSDVGVLKHMTTQKILRVTPKGIDSMFLPNYIHLFLATNEEWAWPAGNRERRGILLDVLDKDDTEYFDALWDEVEHPDFGPALLAWLLHRTVDYGRLRRMRPNTAAMREQQTLSAGPVQLWWEGVLDHGNITPGLPWPDLAVIDDVYSQYVQDMGSQRGAGISHKGSRVQFTKQLMRLLPGRVVPQRRRVRVLRSAHGGPPVAGTELRAVLRMPSVEQCRAQFDKITGFPREWTALDPEEENNPSLFTTEIDEEDL